MTGVGWLAEDQERFLFGTSRPRNFASDLNSGSDRAACVPSSIQSFISGILTYFPAFLVIGGVEMGAMLYAVTDLPRPVGESIYEETGCWDQRRRGPFVYDMNAWQWTRITLDEMEMVCLHFGPEIDKCL